MDSFLDLQYSNIPRRVGCDRMRWQLQENGDWMEELVLEALFGYLESRPVVFDVVIVKGVE